MAKSNLPDPERTTVHQAIRERDGAREVFARFGIDSCCGGDLPLAVAAERHGIELGTLLTALEAAGRKDGG